MKCSSECSSITEFQEAWILVIISALLFVVAEIRVARIFNTYGPRMNIDDGRVVSNFIAQALRYWSSRSQNSIFP